MYTPGQWWTESYSTVCIYIIRVIPDLALIFLVTKTIVRLATGCVVSQKPINGTFNGWNHTGSKIGGGGGGTGQMFRATIHTSLSPLAFCFCVCSVAVLLVERCYITLQPSISGCWADDELSIVCF
jgi:hypothetical protein